MSTETSTKPPEFSRVVGDIIRDPIRVQTYRNLLYLVMMFPLGILYFTLITVGVLTGLGLAIIVVGIPILFGVLTAVVWLAEFERRLVETLLNVGIPKAAAVTDGSVWSRVKQLVFDGRTWTAVGYLLSEFVYGSFVFGLLSPFIATTGSLLLAPFYYRQAPVIVYGPFPTGEFTLDVLFGWETLLVGLTTTFQLGSWQIESLPAALLVAGVGVVLLCVTVQLINGFARVWGRFAAVMLTVPRYWHSSDQ